MLVLSICGCLSLVLDFSFPWFVNPASFLDCSIRSLPPALSPFDFVLSSHESFPYFTLMRTRILIKVMQTCDLWYYKTLHGSILSLQLLNFDFHSDPEPVFDLNAVPDPLPKMIRILPDQDRNTVSVFLCPLVLFLDCQLS